MLDWLLEFWLWCATINLFLMLFNDVIYDRWSTPREYLIFLASGPIALIMTIYAIIGAFVTWCKGKKSNGNE